MKRFLAWVRSWRRLAWQYDMKCTELMRAQNACARLRVELESMTALADRLGREKIRVRVYQSDASRQYCVQVKCGEKMFEAMRVHGDEISTLLARQIMCELKKEAFATAPFAEVGKPEDVRHWPEEARRW